MPDRFKYYTAQEKTQALATLRELVSHPGVIPPLLKGDYDQLLDMLPADFFRRTAQLKIREVASRKRTSLLTELSTSAAKKLASRSLPLDDANLQDMDFLCYINPALWYRTVEEIRTLSPADVSLLTESASRPFLGGTAPKRR